MPWVKFIQDFDFRVSKRAFTAYKKNEIYLVHSRCAQQAIAMGRAVATERPIRSNDTTGKS